MPKEIYIIRHGETEYNRLGIMQGSGVDTDLSEVGRTQAKRFFEHYRHIPFDLFIASKLKRTAQTLAPFLQQNKVLAHSSLPANDLEEYERSEHRQIGINAHTQTGVPAGVPTGAKPTLEAMPTLLRFAEINEMSWGSHEGQQSSPEKIAEYNKIKEGWKNGEIDGRIGGGESAREMAERLSRFLQILRELPQQKILICSHGRSMCGLVTLMMGEHIGEMYKHSHSNTGLWLAKPQGEHYRFLLRDNTRHLEALPQK